MRGLEHVPDWIRIKKKIYDIKYNGNLCRAKFLFIYLFVCLFDCVFYETVVKRPNKKCVSSEKKKLVSFFYNEFLQIQDGLKCEPLTNNTIASPIKPNALVTTLPARGLLFKQLRSLKFFIHTKFSA